MKIAALIPAFDCGRTVGRVVRRTKSVVPDVLVVDDGSTDHTAKFAESGGAEVLRHDVNRGKGAALATGMRRLAKQGFTHALTLDGDGQHLASEIPALIEEAEAHPKAIVVGARRSNAGAAAMKRFGNDFANLWVWIATGIEIPDTQSGFRVYPIAKTLGLGASGSRFDFETEILLRAARAGIEIRSVPIRAYYPAAREAAEPLRSGHRHRPHHPNGARPHSAAPLASPSLAPAAPSLPKGRDIGIPPLLWGEVARSAGEGEATLFLRLLVSREPSRISASKPFSLGS